GLAFLILDNRDRDKRFAQDVDMVVKAVDKQTRAVDNFRKEVDKIKEQADISAGEDLEEVILSFIGRFGLRRLI
ncbi:hypothetical protein, partial [Bacillus sp. EB600]|uniref:hypothetical protein n=1 Tax=Bacillus sp. EB600 TaxID=2806345 RepID=UPI00210BD8AE